MKIKVDQIWPGVLIKQHENKGRVVDVLSIGFAPWGVEKVEILFPIGESVTMAVDQIVEIIDE